MSRSAVRPLLAARGLDEGQLLVEDAVDVEDDRFAGATRQFAPAAEEHAVVVGERDVDLAKDPVAAPLTLELLSRHTPPLGRSGDHEESTAHLEEPRALVEAGVEEQSPVAAGVLPLDHHPIARLRGLDREGRGIADEKIEGPFEAATQVERSEEIGPHRLDADVRGEAVQEDVRLDRVERSGVVVESGDVPRIEGEGRNRLDPGAGAEVEDAVTRLDRFGEEAREGLAEDGRHPDAGVLLDLDLAVVDGQGSDGHVALLVRPGLAGPGRDVADEGDVVAPDLLEHGPEADPELVVDLGVEVHGVRVVAHPQRDGEVDRHVGPGALEPSVAAEGIGDRLVPLAGPHPLLVDLLDDAGDRRVLRGHRRPLVEVVTGEGVGPGLGRDRQVHGLADRGDQLAVDHAVAELEDLGDLLVGPDTDAAAQTAVRVEGPTELLLEIRDRAEEEGVERSLERRVAHEVPADHDERRVLDPGTAGAQEPLDLFASRGGLVGTELGGDVGVWVVERRTPHHEEAGTAVPGLDGATQGLRIAPDRGHALERPLGEVGDVHIPDEAQPVVQPGPGLVGESRSAADVPGGLVQTTRHPLGVVDEHVADRLRKGAVVGSVTGVAEGALDRGETDPDGEGGLAAPGRRAAVDLERRHAQVTVGPVERARHGEEGDPAGIGDLVVTFEHDVLQGPLLALHGDVERPSLEQADDELGDGILTVGVELRLHGGFLAGLGVSTVGP